MGQMEIALDTGCVLDLLSKAAGEEAVFTFTAQSILLPRNFILTISLVRVQCICKGNVFLVCICMTEFY